MSNNSKKSIFTKKNITMCIVILLAIIFVILLFLTNKSKQNLMSCTMPVGENEFATGTMEVDVYYTKKINKMTGKIYMNITDDYLKENIDILKNRVDNLYKGIFTHDSVSMSTSIKDNTIIVNYSIDCNKLNMSDLENFDLFTLKEDQEEFTVDSLRQQAINVGGTCVEK